MYINIVDDGVLPEHTASNTLCQDIIKLIALRTLVVISLTAISITMQYIVVFILFYHDESYGARSFRSVVSLLLMSYLVFLILAISTNRSMYTYSITAAIIAGSFIGVLEQKINENIVAESLIGHFVMNALIIATNTVRTWVNENNDDTIYDDGAANIN